MDKTVIRRATAADAGGLTAALDAAYAPYRHLPGLPDVTADLADDIARHDVWVADGPGGILGGVVLSMDGDAAHLVNLGVSPAGAGGGLGRRLVETALEWARDRGANRARLGTHRDMEGTRRCYRQLGWTEVEATGGKVVLEVRL